MSRTIEKEVVVKAPPDEVWNALTNAEELTRWFPVHARIEGGAGGTIWLSWGGGTEGRAPITAWEPHRRFGWTESRGPVRLAVDFHLSPRDGGTVVRLVQSGFGDGPDWDAEYHMTQGGWSYFVEHLRWYLERHRGTPRDLIVFREPLALPGQEAFARLTRALGVSRNGAGVDLGEHEPFRATTADGDPLSGQVVSLSPGTGQMGLTMSELDEAILFLEMEPNSGGCRAGFWLSTYGLPADRLGEARTRFGGLYTRALGLV
jgi:uncharacterized protein YndB with AHSA1/START domain